MKWISTDDRLPLEVDVPAGASLFGADVLVARRPVNNSPVEAVTIAFYLVDRKLHSHWALLLPLPTNRVTFTTNASGTAPLGEV